MPYADPEVARIKRKEAYVRRMAADPDYQKRLYRKHRDKRLAAKRASRSANIEAARVYQRAMYAKHREKNVEGARRYRLENADAVNARAKEKYHANRDAINERRKGYRAKHYAKIYASNQKWRKENPDREFLYHAKRLLAEQTGLRVRDIPNEIAEAKM